MMLTNLSWPPHSIKSRGFTTVELLTIIAIIGILAIISVPAYRQISPTINLNSTTRELSSDLRYAQQLAVTEQIAYAVNFDLDNNQYTIINTQSESIIKTKSLDSQVNIENIIDLTDDTVTFNATGAASENGKITLINQNGRQITIEIKPSGYVKVQN